MFGPGPWHETGRVGVHLCVEDARQGGCYRQDEYRQCGAEVGAVKYIARVWCGPCVVDTRVSFARRGGSVKRTEALCRLVSAGLRSRISLVPVGRSGLYVQLVIDDIHFTELRAEAMDGGRTSQYQINGIRRERCERADGGRARHARGYMTMKALHGAMLLLGLPVPQSPRVLS